MTRVLILKFLFLLFVSIAKEFNQIAGDVGTAAKYSPPYIPTTCYGNDPSQFPSSNLFGAAGDGIWDNGAACGRQYLVKCINAPAPYACTSNDENDNTIQITIVDYAPSHSASTTMILSETAVGTMATPSAEWINIEFQQV